MLEKLRILSKLYTNDISTIFMSHNVTNTSQVLSIFPKILHKDISKVLSYNTWLRDLFLLMKSIGWK